MQVGEIIQVDKDSFFPSDLLLLSVPESPEGICYVETINLDGESNLKIKKGLEQTKELEQMLGTFRVSLRWRLCTLYQLLGTPTVGLRWRLCTLYQQYTDRCWIACHADHLHC